MLYSQFETIFSKNRTQRYLDAMCGDTRKAMTLYRYNLRLSYEMFSIISCFEIALRNAIDRRLTVTKGDDWLRNAARSGGIFAIKQTNTTKDIIHKALTTLKNEGLGYTHSRLVAEMEFGIWKYMFAKAQYKATGSCLLQIFPNKPKSSREHQYNQTYVFNELHEINRLRNRIAHHEPICFQSNSSAIDTSYLLANYNRIMMFFSWMDIDSKSLLYGLDHVKDVCNKINSL